MLIKNRPNRTSWKGRMSVSTWCLYSVSEISMPAINAPSARLKPANSVSQARASVISSRLSTNNSSLLRRATSVNHQRMTCWPPTSNTAISKVAFTAARASAPANSSPAAPSAGMRTSSGTTARSWNNNTPITRFPCSESISSRSTISFTTIAVLLIASAPESASAVCQLMPQTLGANDASNSVASVAASIVKATWNRPSPKTWLRIARSLARLNSRPITNIRNTTPNSPR